MHTLLGITTMAQTITSYRVSARGLSLNFHLAQVNNCV